MAESPAADYETGRAPHLALINPDAVSCVPRTSRAMGLCRSSALAFVISFGGSGLPLAMQMLCRSSADTTQMLRSVVLTYIIYIFSGFLTCYRYNLAIFAVPFWRSLPVPQPVPLRTKAKTMKRHISTRSTSSRSLLVNTILFASLLVAVRALES